MKYKTILLFLLFAFCSQGISEEEAAEIVAEAVALAIKDNKHPFEISKMLGHTSIKTTFDVYGHLL